MKTAATDTTTMNPEIKAAVPMRAHRLADLLPEGVVAVPELMLSALTLDSREVQPGCGFIALPGAIQHGMKFALQAQAAGASVVIWQPAAGITVPPKLTIPAVAVDNLRTHLGEIAAKLYDQPGATLRIIGVTGTNGKTSTTRLLAQALNLLGQRCGSIGTLGVQLESGNDAADVKPEQADIRTTPDAISLQRTLRWFVDQGAAAVAMEVSSHALDQQRVGGVPFELAIFTNLTRDHLDYHESMAAYGSAKAKLFEFASLKSAVINIDDDFGRTLYAQLAPRLLGISFGLKSDCDVRAENIVLNSDGASFTLCVPRHVAGHVPGHKYLIQTALYGRFNVVNLLGVIAALIARGYSMSVITPVIAMLQPVTGRMNRLGGGDQALVVVDYAHTPDALAQVLINLREHLFIADSKSSHGSNKLICVFGCGGDRDPGKRRLMGSAAEEFADLAIITNDNPRSESETAITDQILSGFKGPNGIVEHRRERAIELAIMQAKAGDIVLIAGKGHENYQEIAGVKHPFNDSQVALAVLEKQKTSLTAGSSTAGLSTDGMHLALSEFADLAGATLIAPNLGGQVFDPHAVYVQSIGNDTRTLDSGAVFVAIKGERVDGHTLLAQAKALGAVAALVSVQTESALPQILVQNVEAALAQLASAWCQRMPAKRIAITGSNGKTTVKNLTASILAQVGATLATAGNLNNELGLPLTVLRIRQQHQFAVLEMGAGKPGDIRYLANIARPQVALVNNAMAAHLERLGDVHGVAEEKSSIYRALVPGGTAVINLDDAELACFLHAASQAGAAKLTFSLHSPAADVYATDVKLGAASTFTLHCPLGSAAISLALVGSHNIRNALAAAGLALAAGANLAQISAGLNLASSTEGRLQLHPQPGGWNLLDDSYNANPGSVKAGIDALVALGGRAWVVLGNMAELGNNADALHREVGAHARDVGVEKLFCLGAQAAHTAQSAGAIGEWFTDIDALVGALRENLTQSRSTASSVNLLVKGSRSAKMERVAMLLGADIAHVGTH